MKKVIFAIFLALLFCGQIKAQEKISSVYLPDLGKWEYTISIPGLGPDRNAPFLQGDWAGWEKEDLVAGEIYYFKVTCYNGPIMFSWSDYNKPWNKIMQTLDGYDQASGCIKLYCYDGNVTTTPPEVKLPGNFGDQLMRWTYNNDGTVSYYYNIAALEAGSIKPFVLHSANKWTEVPLLVTDASGWGSNIVTIKDNRYQENGVDVSDYLGSGYGAYKDGKKVYPANILQSEWLNSDSTGLKSPLLQNLLIKQ
jgi:hypothetical protein